MTLQVLVKYRSNIEKKLNSFVIEYFPGKKSSQILDYDRGCFGSLIIKFIYNEHFRILNVY